MINFFNYRYITILFAGVLGLSSSYFNEPYSKISLVELGLGFLVVTYVYLKSAKRQHKHGVFSQWSDTGAFIKMELDDGEKFLFVLGVVMIVSPLLSFVMHLLPTT